jgi:hypothetical protein
MIQHFDVIIVKITQNMFFCFLRGRLFHDTPTNLYHIALNIIITYER